MKKYLLLLSSSSLLFGCVTSGPEFTEIKMPQFWGAGKEVSPPVVEIESIKSWWLKFEDPALNKLVDLSLSDSPDRLIAEARVLEARGMRRSSRSSLFPQVGVSASGGRQKTLISQADDYHDAGFDATYEIDVFGKNRKKVTAADAEIERLEAQYQDVTLSLIAEVARSYIDYRAFQTQATIAKKNLKIQEKTLELIRQQRKFGEAPQLDVERAENLVNTTKSSIPGFQRQEDNARLQLSVLTGHLPDVILTVLGKHAEIPKGTIQPILSTPAQVLSLRPDIRAASASLSKNTALAESITAELFPTFSVGGFFGVAKSAINSSTSIWDVALGAAVSILDFGRIEGRIDSARAREIQAYQSYKRTILEAVSEVESALTDTAHIDKQRVSLQKAYKNAEHAFQLSEMLYKEGEISFLDVLVAQRTVNESDAARVNVEAKYAESLVRLYKALGVY